MFLPEENDYLVGIIIDESLVDSGRKIAKNSDVS